MARLPKVGGDDGSWGSILNAFLSVAHNPNGTLKKIPQSKIINLTNNLAELKTSIEDEAAARVAGDENSLDRSNHTGTQEINTITGLQSELDDKLDEATADAAYAPIAPYRVSLASNFEVHDLAADSAQMLAGTFTPESSTVVLDVDAAYAMKGAARGALYLYVGQPDTPGTRLYDAGAQAIAGVTTYAMGAVPADTLWPATTHRSITLTNLDTSKKVTWQLLAGIVGSSESYVTGTAAAYGQMAISPNGRHGIVANTNDGTATLIALGRPGYSLDSTLTPQDVKRTPVITVGSFPIAVACNNTTAVVGNYVANTVSIIDIASGTVTATTAALGAANGVIELTMEPNGTHALAVGLHGLVSRITLATGAVSAVTPGAAGNDLYGVAVSADGTKAWVSNETAGTVYELALPAMTTTRTYTLTAGYKPRGVKVAPDGGVWVLCRPNSPAVGRLVKLTAGAATIDFDYALPYTLPNIFAIVPVAGQTSSTVRTAWVTYNGDQWGQFNIGGIFAGTSHTIHRGDFGSDIGTGVAVNDYGEIWFVRYANGVLRLPGGRLSCRAADGLFLGEYLTVSAAPASA